MISRTMYDLLKVRFFEAPSGEMKSIAGVLGGDESVSVTTNDGDVLMFDGSGAVSFNGIPIGTIHKMSYDITRLSLELYGDVNGFEEQQPLTWSVRF